MKERRPTVLMFILLVLLASYFSKPYVDAYLNPEAIREAPPPPLAGNNEIKNIKVTKNSDGTYTADVEYFYRGDGFFAAIAAQAINGPENISQGMVSTGQLERGTHTIKIQLQHPMNPQGEVVTRKISAQMRVGNLYVSPTTIDYVIEWPDVGTYFQKIQLAKMSNEDLYKEAVASIDEESESGQKTAKRDLETILLRDPNYVLAYPEMARVAMKQNWGPEGLRQAESYLNTGFRLEPGNANVNVLLGYVYAHQKRYAEAQKKFEEVEKIGTKNLWLWTNWGELFDMQKKPKLAKEKYLVAINSPRGYDTYDRAKVNAYFYLITILENEKSYDELDALYKKRSEEFEKYTNYLADYGLYRLTQFKDYQSGISYAKSALEKGCECDEAKYTLGMSYYVAWTKSSGDEKNNSFNQANIFLPKGPKALYELARFEETAKVIPVLIENGYSMQMQDNEKYDAMAYALYANDVDAAQRLAKNGARFDAPITEQNFPVGLVAFQRENIKAIKMMKHNGVNFAALKFQGMSALDYARKMNNKEILDVVESGAKYQM